MLIAEHTWHPSESDQTSFSWESVEAGVSMKHDKGGTQYIIPWNVFSAVLLQAQRMAQDNCGTVTAGVSEDSPTPGSVGEWVKSHHFGIIRGKLTPRHLSFLGPIFGRMGFVRRRVKGRSIQWELIK